MSSGVSLMLSKPCIVSQPSQSSFEILQIRGYSNDESPTWPAASLLNTTCSRQACLWLYADGCQGLRLPHILWRGEKFMGIGVNAIASAARCCSTQSGINFHSWPTKCHLAHSSHQIWLIMSKFRPDALTHWLAKPSMVSLQSHASSQLSKTGSHA